MSLLAALVLGALSGLAGILGLERHRRVRFTAEAAGRGWTFARRDPALTFRWESWPFATGRQRRAVNVLRGSVRGRSCVAFEYSYRHRVPGGPYGEAEATARWTVAAVALPSRLPRIAVTRSGPDGRGLTSLGRQALAVDGAAFDASFAVRTDDPRTAAAVLAPALTAALLTGPFFDFRMEAADALSCWPGRMKLEDVDERLAFLSTVVDNVPIGVWRDRSR